MTQDSEDTPNEILATARLAKEHRDRSAERQRRWPLVGIGVGIGSAAVVAAMLYANRPRTDRKD